jgi:hypothetical protein
LPSRKEPTKPLWGQVEWGKPVPRRGLKGVIGRDEMDHRWSTRSQMFTIRYFPDITRLPCWDRWRPELGNGHRNPTGPGKGELDLDRFETAKAERVTMGYRPGTSTGTSMGTSKRPHQPPQIYPLAGVEQSCPFGIIGPVPESATYLTVAPTGLVVCRPATGSIQPG